MSMRVLVTGGGGFLGSAIVRMLRERGDSVNILCRGEYPKIAQMGATIFRGDIADFAMVKNAARGCDAVIHTAASAGIWGSYRDYYRTNVEGTRHVIKAALELGIGKLVYTSSPSVAYGREGAKGADESLPYPKKYQAHYPATKAEAERLVLAADSDQLATCALRPHLIWGPEDNHLVPRIIDRACRGRLYIVGDGCNLIDSIYIENAAYAHLLALDRLTPGIPPAGKAYFLSQDQPIPVAELINRILEAAGMPPAKKHISIAAATFLGMACELGYRLCRISREPPMTRFLAHQLSSPHWFDIKAAKRDLGYSPIVTIEEGMRRLAAWCLG